MNDIWQRYGKNWTDLSLNELVNFARWMNKIIGYHPTIIGGWAVYLYNPVMGSRDIDVLLPSREIKEKVINLYLANNGYELRDKAFGEAEWVKYLEPGNPDSETYLDTCTFQDKNLVHGTNIEIPWVMANKWQRRKRFMGTDIFVPAPEPLLILKSKAAYDRGYELAKTGLAYYRDKLRKDRSDILALILRCEFDGEIVAEIVTECNFKKYFLDVIGQVLSDKDALKRHDLKGMMVKKLEDKILNLI